VASKGGKAVNQAEGRKKNRGKKGKDLQAWGGVGEKKSGKISEV